MGQVGQGDTTDVRTASTPTLPCPGEQEGALISALLQEPGSALLHPQHPAQVWHTVWAQ